MQINIEHFFKTLRQKGFDLFIGVPCSMLKDLISYAENSIQVDYIHASSEGEAVSIAVGAKLAGRKSVVLCQNSGLGNMVNPMTSLVITYQIPILIIMSHRGVSQDAEHQHSYMGRITIDLLKLLAIKIFDFPEDEIKNQKLLSKIANLFDQGVSSCLLVQENIESINTTTNLIPSLPNADVNVKDNGLDKVNLMTKIVNKLSRDTLYISTTGYTSRELYQIQDTVNNFYMVGSMGYANALSFGLSTVVKDKKIVIFDGDGALLMHMGNLSTIGNYKPQNVCHIVFNNLSYVSTGGQANSSKAINFLGIAKSCGYKKLFNINHDNLENILSTINSEHGPYFIHAKVNSDVQKALRPSVTPIENALRFSHFITKGLI